MRKVLQYLLALLVFLVSVSSAALTSDQLKVKWARIKKNAKKWAANAPSDYSYTIGNSCFCPAGYRGPWKITVKNGKNVGAVYVGADPTTPADKKGGRKFFKKNYGTMDLVYASIIKEYAQMPEPGQSVQKWTAKYDYNLWYLKSFTYDILELADEEAFITVTDFKVLLAD